MRRGCGMGWRDCSDARLRWRRTARRSTRARWSMRELRGWPLEAVRTLAVEIAMLGAQGISPRKKYKLKSLPNRGEMYGEEVLAYYYATWAKVFPDKLDVLGLPYKAAYASALAMSERFQ